MEFLKTEKGLYSKKDSLTVEVSLEDAKGNLVYQDKTKNYEIAIKRAFQLKESSFLLIDLDLYTKMGLIGQNVLIKTSTKKQADFNEV